MTTDNFCFYFQNRLIQTSQTEGQQHGDTSPFSVPAGTYLLLISSAFFPFNTLLQQNKLGCFGNSFKEQSTTAYCTTA
jgi:hypothetical protein